MSVFKMKHLILFFLMFLILIPLILADTTFFDNPHDFFIINGSSTSGAGVTGGIAETTNEGGGCEYTWNCTGWGECYSGKQLRTCVNIGTCSDTYNPPKTEQNCSYASVPGIETENETKNTGEEKFGNEIVDVGEILVYSVAILLILSIFFYLKRDFFRKLIRKL